VLREASEGDWPVQDADSAVALENTGSMIPRLDGLVNCEPLPWELWGRDALPSECPHLTGRPPPKQSAGIRNIGSSRGLQNCEPLPWEIWGRTALPSECPHLGWAFLHPKTTAGMKGHRLYMWVEELRTVALGNLGEDSLPLRVPSPRLGVSPSQNNTLT
jgi:hypothetical protein